MFGVIMPLCNRMFCCIFGWYLYIKIRLKYEKKIFCCPALELFHCLILWKTVLFVSSRAFSLYTPVENSEATWKRATKCNKINYCKYFDYKQVMLGKSLWSQTCLQPCKFQYVSWSKIKNSWGHTYACKKSLG